MLKDLENKPQNWSYCSLRVAGLKKIAKFAGSYSNPEGAGKFHTI